MPIKNKRQQRAQRFMLKCASKCVGSDKITTSATETFLSELPPLDCLTMADPKAIFGDSDDNHGNDSNTLDKEPKCLKCGKVQNMMKRCTRCRSAFYCSRACFVKHWPTHRGFCQPDNNSGENREEKHPDFTVRCVCQEISTGPDLNSGQTIVETTSLEGLKEASHTTIQKQQSAAEVIIVLKFMKEKMKFIVQQDWEGEVIIKKISDFLVIVPHTMRLICKGRQLSSSTVKEVISPGVVMQVIGEKLQDASGLNLKDVEVMMAQMKLTWNEAVGALRLTNGDLIDAMVFAGNKA